MYRSYDNYLQNNNKYSYDSNTYIQSINKLYPEIYRIIYPIIQKECSKRNITSLNDSLLDKMVDEIYNVIESDDSINDISAPIKNGDVRNPRINRPPRRNNQLLRDLIRILLLREILGERPETCFGCQNNFPGGPGMPPPPPRPPIMRPRKCKNFLKM